MGFGCNVIRFGVMMENNIKNKDKFISESILLIAKAEEFLKSRPSIFKRVWKDGAVNLGDVVIWIMLGILLGLGAFLSDKTIFQNTDMNELGWAVEIVALILAVFFLMLMGQKVRGNKTFSSQYTLIFREYNDDYSINNFVDFIEENHSKFKKQDIDGAIEMVKNGFVNKGFHEWFNQNVVTVLALIISFLALIKLPVTTAISVGVFAFLIVFLVKSVLPKKSRYQRILELLNFFKLYKQS